MKFKRPKKWMLEKDLSFSSDLTKEDIKKFKDAKVDVKITATVDYSTEGYITDLASVREHVGHSLHSMWQDSSNTRHLIRKN
nr:MAG: hypothetical protein CM15mV30_0270 [uncultured marine virus]